MALELCATQLEDLVDYLSLNTTQFEYQYGELVYAPESVGVCWGYRSWLTSSPN